MKTFREILEDNLSNVAKKKRAEKADIAKIRNDLQTTKKTVTKRVDGLPDTTTVTITDPESNTTARKVISADPTVPVTDTITTQEIGGDFSSDLSHLGEELEEEKISELKMRMTPADKAVGDAEHKKHKKRKEEFLKLVIDDVNEEKLNEDLQALDLEDLVKSTVFVDKHKSKLGEDKDVIVLAMEVKNNDAAKDLMTFIERGYTDVIDADHISSENINGDYVVFVEFERKDTFKDVLTEMLKGVEKLTGINEWAFKHHKSNRTLTLEELHNTLPITPEEYDSFLAKEQNIKDQLQQLKINARVPMK